MQPCVICGSVSINAEGYCARCGTFRGGPAAPGSAGYGQPDYSGYPPPVDPYGSPVSGAGYHPPSTSGTPAYSGSGAPAYPPASGPTYPTMGSPQGLPTSGPSSGYPTNVPHSGYPGGYPPPQQKRSMLVPLTALASTLFVLIVGIVVVLAVREDGGENSVGPTLTSSPSPTQSTGSPDVDECVVGRWEMVQHIEEVVLDKPLHNTEFTGGQGAVLELNADGTGRLDFGAGTSYIGNIEGLGKAELRVAGQIRYRFTARNGTFANQGVIDSNATSVLYVDDEVVAEEPFETGDDPVKYTCSDDRMVHKTSLYETQFRRMR